MRIPMLTRFDLPTAPRSVFVLALLFGPAGCGGPTPDAASTPPPAAPEQTPTTAIAADPDDVPITEADVARPKDYAEALGRIEGYRDTIRDEVAAGRPTKAHGALDELDIVLNWLPSIARDSGVPKERWEEVNTTAQGIRDLFNQVHSRIDAKQEPDYGSVSEAIDLSIASLKALTPAPVAGETAVKP